MFNSTGASDPLSGGYRNPGFTLSDEEPQMAKTELIETMQDILHDSGATPEQLNAIKLFAEGMGRRFESQRNSGVIDNSLAGDILKALEPIGQKTDQSPCDVGSSQSLNKEEDIYTARKNTFFEPENHDGNKSSDTGIMLKTAAPAAAGGPASEIMTSKSAELPPLRKETGKLEAAGFYSLPTGLGGSAGRERPHLQSMMNPEASVHFPKERAEKQFNIEGLNVPSGERKSRNKTGARAKTRLRDTSRHDYDHHGSFELYPAESSERPFSSLQMSAVPKERVGYIYYQLQSLSSDLLAIPQPVPKKTTTKYSHEMPHASSPENSSAQDVSKPQAFVDSAGRPSKINNSDVPLNISKENEEPDKLDMAAGGTPGQELQNSGNTHSGNEDSREVAAVSNSMAVATGTLNSGTVPSVPLAAPIPFTLPVPLTVSATTGPASVPSTPPASSKRQPPAPTDTAPGNGMDKYLAAHGIDTSAYSDKPPSRAKARARRKNRPKNNGEAETGKKRNESDRREVPQRNAPPDPTAAPGLNEGNLPAPALSATQSSAHTAPHNEHALSDAAKRLAKSRAANTEHSRNFLPSDDEEDTAQNVDPEEVRKENKRLKDAKMCRVCKDKDANRLFLPCAHLSSCSLCSPAVTKCPQCRAGIRGVVSVYFG